MTLPLTAAIIAFNEQDKIEDCLLSVVWAEEKLVVDSHSADATRDIAGGLGARVIERDWPGHVAQKNFALESASYEWVLSIDADERISEKLCGEIRSVMKNPAADGYRMPRKVFYINRWINHCGWYPAPKIRLVRKNRARWGGVDPHDTLLVDGKVENLKGDIYHLSFDSIHDHFRTINSFTRVGAEEAFKRGKRANAADITVRPLFTFVKMYFLKLGFLDGMAGFIACALSAFHTFSKYDRLYGLADCE
jgi:glycosyltransferase involved in cell wall biosynthesis